MFDKDKFKITISKDYMPKACGCSHDRQMKMNTKQGFPHCVWESYLKTSSCLAFNLSQEGTTTSSSSERANSKVSVPLTLVVRSDDQRIKVYTQVWIIGTPFIILESLGIPHY